MSGFSERGIGSGRLYLLKYITLMFLYTMNVRLYLLRVIIEDFGKHSTNIFNTHYLRALAGFES